LDFASAPYLACLLYSYLHTSRFEVRRRLSSTQVEAQIFYPTSVPAETFDLLFFFCEGAVSRHRNPHSLGPILGHALHGLLSVKRPTCYIACCRSCV